MASREHERPESVVSSLPALTGGARPSRKTTMSDIRLNEHLTKQLDDIRAAGTFKRERVIDSAQGADIRVNHKNVINFCANNYLGLANHPEIVKAAHAGLDEYGFGMASVRFICGTATPH